MKTLSIAVVVTCVASLSAACTTTQQRIGGAAVGGVGGAVVGGPVGAAAGAAAGAATAPSVMR